MSSLPPVSPCTAAKARMVRYSVTHVVLELAIKMGDVEKSEQKSDDVSDFSVAVTCSTITKTNTWHLFLVLVDR